MTIYENISANKRSTWILMFLFVVFVAGIAELIALLLGGGYIAGIVVLVLAGIFVTIGYYSASSLGAWVTSRHKTWSGGDGAS
jgi:hypothetical protein